MNNRIALLGIVAASLVAATPAAECADAQTNTPPARLTREQWQKMTPEERQARTQELRQKRATSTNAAPLTLREELRNLSPAEREAKLQELRAKQGLPPLSPELQKRRDELMKLSPAERQAKIEEIRKSRPSGATVDEKAREQRRAALQKKLAELRAKKAEGKLTPQDEKRLEQLEKADLIMKAHPPTDKSAEKPTAESGKTP